MKLIFSLGLVLAVWQPVAIRQLPERRLEVGLGVGHRVGSKWAEGRIEGVARAGAGFIAGVFKPTKSRRSVPQGIQVYFSPNGGATDAVVRSLERATNMVLVQAYSFTSAPIAKALTDAHQRGAKVQVILDRSQRTEKYSEADFLKHNGIPTLIDAQHAIAHNKIIIIDGYLVLTGSFNFTKVAEEHNAENLLVINDPALAKEYTQNWEAHQAHSEPYEREAQAGAPTGRRKGE